MGLADTIRMVAGFADKGTESINEWWQQVHFKKGECFAQTSLGGVCRPIDLNVECGVNAQKLLKGLKAVSGPLEAKKENGQFLLKSEACLIRLQTADHINPPTFYYPEAKKKDWKETDLLHEAKRIAWCVASDPSRQHLHGIQLGDKGMMCTNGHAMAVIYGDDFSKKLGEPVLLPSKLLLDLPVFCWITKNSNRVFVADSEDKKSFRVLNAINAQFPDLSQIINLAKDQPSATVNRGAFLDVVKRAALSNSQVVLEVKGDQLFVSVDGAVLASLFSFLDTVELFDKESMSDGKIGLDATYLKPALENTVSETIKIKMNPTKTGGLDPVSIEDDYYLIIMMPYRL